MKEIKPLEKIDAVVEAPPAKGVTLRALFISALASGESSLENALLAEDQVLAVKALEEMGIKIERAGNALFVSGGRERLKAPEKEIFLGNSGVSMRFLTSVATLAQGQTILTGTERMQERPIKDLVDALQNLGVKAECKNDCPPVKITGGLEGGMTTVDTAKSSQFLSSLLIAAPYAKEEVTIKVKGKLRSKPFIGMTLQTMKDFGIEVENNDFKEFKVPKGEFMAQNYRVEGDYSNASYFMAAAAITGGKVKVTNLRQDSTQGDKFFLELLEKMGCEIERDNDSVTVQGRALKGISVDMNDYPDIVPTLAVVAAFAQGQTEIKNIEHLRLKETDRIKAVVTELKKCGVKARETKDSILIEESQPKSAEIETYNDHRIAMSFAAMGLRTGMQIKGEDCVKKSFPHYFEELKKLGE
jgi:3-phosphoshikimate 1-carboxyvinyltransferase